MKNTICAAMVLAAFVYEVGLVLAQKPMAEIPLVIWFGAQPANGITSDGRQVSVAIGGAAVTADYANGVENVGAIVYPSGNFGLTMQSNPRQAVVRWGCVNFGTQLDDVSMAPLPGINQCVSLDQVMHGYATGDVAIQKLALNQQVRKLTRLAWTENGYRWRIGYGTDMDQNGSADAPPVVVTCIEAGSSCTKWLMTPEGSNGEAALFRFALGKRDVEGPAELVANVNMPFSMTLQRR